MLPDLTDMGVCLCVGGMGTRHKGRGGKMPETDGFQGHEVH